MLGIIVYKCLILRATLCEHLGRRALPQRQCSGPLVFVLILPVSVCESRIGCVSVFRPGGEYVVSIKIALPESSQFLGLCFDPSSEFLYVTEYA